MRENRGGGGSGEDEEEGEEGEEREGEGGVRRRHQGGEVFQLSGKLKISPTNFIGSYRTILTTNCIVNFLVLQFNVLNCPKMRVTLSNDLRVKNKNTSEIETEFVPRIYCTTY